MKRFIAVLSGLLVLPAFAEVAPIYYDEIIEYNDEMIDEYEPIVEEEEEAISPVTTQPKVIKRNVAGRSVSRAISAGATNTNSRTNTNTRAVASSPRNAQQTQRGTISRTAAKTQTVSARPAVVSRSSRATNASTRQQVSTRSRTTVAARSATSTARNTTENKPVTARVSATGNIISGMRDNNSIAAKTLTDSGDPLYISNSARIGTGRRSTTARNSSVGTTTPIITNENITETTSSLDALAELTDYCKAQYAQCMDNYCNVLDDNQGRCSCSGNIKKYEQVEKSLATSSEDFQDIVQKIKYIGLTAAQVEALFAETEAELAMKSNSDTSVLKNSLELIKDKIIDVSSSKSDSNLFDGSSIDISGLFNNTVSSAFDLNSFLGNSKVSNQRGTSLFNTATQRCKTAVLNSCVAQGIDANVVINSYDLAIDKQCIEYERSLNEANDEMRNNVRNAQNILQQARLLLAQKKNEYDLRGCVAALDECMQDEYVCGDDYELCLDPTGKYLANGEIVKGGIPGVAGGSSVNQHRVTATNITSWISCGMYGLYSTWDYGDNGTPCSCTDASCSGNVTNAWGKGTGENLNAYIAEKTDTWETIYDSANLSKYDNDMAIYLLRRIGYIDAKKDKSYGMCANVLKQCQDYTYEIKGANKTYKPNNEVIRQYLSLALTKIKLKQDTILADYAETCWNDVYSCLSANSYDENNVNTTASKTAVNACRGDIATCMSVSGYYPSDNTTLTLAAMTNWVASKLISCDTNQFLKVEPVSGTVTTLNTVGCLPCGWANCVNAGDTAETAASVGCNKLHVNGEPVLAGETSVGYGIQLVSAGGQVASCKCPEGFTMINKTNSGDGEPTSTGSSMTGYSTTIECKWNGTSGS